MQKNTLLAISIGLVLVLSLTGLIYFLRTRSVDIGPPVSDSVAVTTSTNTDGNATTTVGVPSVLSTEDLARMQADAMAQPEPPASAHPERYSSRRIGDVSAELFVGNDANLVLPTNQSTNTVIVTDLVDTDLDTISDAEESRYGTDPKKKDTDGDTYSDADEIKNGYNPLGPGKCAVSTCIIK